MRTNSDKIFQVVTGVPVIVANFDDGSASRNLLRDLRDTPEVEVVGVIGEAAGITAEMLNVGASGAVVIPNDFSDKISRGESVSVELIIDNTNTILGGTVTRAVQSVVATESAEILAVDRIVAGWNTYQAQTARLSLSTRVFYNPTGGYSDFFLTVLILHSVQIALVFGIAPSIVEEKLAGAKINLAAVLFTGAIWSRFSMDAVSLALSYAVPIGWAAEDLRNLFLKGAAYGWENHALILLGFGTVFFAVGGIGLKITGGANFAGTAGRGVGLRAADWQFVRGRQRF